jgi:aldehyde:ferredoxin oxidoreductase
MIRDHFRVLKVALDTGQGKVVKVDGRNEYAGGSGLAAVLFDKYGRPDQPWDHPDQPLIFAIGPLSGYFPLMSKTVCGFKSPYHDQYAESHAGGRSALSMRFADLDAVVVTGRAPRLSCLSVGYRHLKVTDTHYMQGMQVEETGKLLRRMFGGSGHRSILRIGPAGERQSAMACINADTYRHFGRLGSGAVMGAKNLKAIVLLGDGSFKLPEGKAYAALFDKVHQKVTATEMMDKYHNLGTAVNVAKLNELQALPIRNLQATRDPHVAAISGEAFADRTLLRNSACSGCPVGCIHVGFVREKFMEPNQYLYRQVAYDFEPIFATGSMLGVTDPFGVLDIMDEVEAVGLDVMSAGVALAWATEAYERGILTEKETLVPLKFGDIKAYQKAVHHLAYGRNDFYQLLAEGTLRAAEQYGAEDSACVLGQEMAGYATGEVFFVSQAMGFRHSHLDSGGYSFDQKHPEKDPAKAVEYLLADEQDRVFQTSMVVCLFARKVYTDTILAECLDVLGYHELSGNLDSVSAGIQKLRWRMRLATGYDPGSVTIPKRFLEVVNWKGNIDAKYLKSLQQGYAKAIKAFATEA